MRIILYIFLFYFSAINIIPSSLIHVHHGQLANDFNFVYQKAIDNESHDPVCHSEALIEHLFEKGFINTSLKNVKIESQLDMLFLSAIIPSSAVLYYISSYSRIVFILPGARQGGFFNLKFRAPPQSFTS